MPSYSYRTDVLEALGRHGVRPTAHTPPDVIHEFVSDLYRYELRLLRERLRRNEFPRREYFDRVVELRNRYAIISMPLSDWLE